MLFDTSDSLASLRCATSSRHMMLDRSMPLSLPHPTLRDYRDHLHLLRQWLMAIIESSAVYRDGPQDVSLLSPVDRLALIDIDLAHPSLPPDDLAMFQVVGRRHNPTSAAYRWGEAYVVEGSQLGGTVLFGRLAQCLAPHPLRYLNALAPPGTRWREFTRRIREQVQGADAIADACAGACDAFDHLIRLNSAYVDFRVGNA